MLNPLKSWPVFLKGPENFSGRKDFVLCTVFTRKIQFLLILKAYYCSSGGRKPAFLFS